MDKGTERERNFRKILFLKVFFENSFYLIHFSCGLVSYHHTKIKLKFKLPSLKSLKINRYAVGHKLELKCLICHKYVKYVKTLENMYMSLLSVHCTTSLCQI